MQEYTEKDLIELLKVSQQALNKMLKDTPYILKNIEGSSKRVKHYKYDDLPKRYKEKIEVPQKEVTNILSTNFTKKYLLASPQKKKIAILKCRLIEYYLKRDNSMSAVMWLDKEIFSDPQFDELGKVSEKVLFDWLRKYKESKAKGANIVEAFIDARGKQKGKVALNEAQKEVAQRYFLKANRPKISEVYRNMCHTFGDMMPGYDALNNYYKEWKRLNPMLHEFSKSPDSAKNKYLVAYGDMSAKAKYKNHYWELDSTPADVICEDGKRYSVIAAIDIHTRRAVFHVAESSSSYTISQLLRKAILKLGIPENVVIDNGKDYTSNHFESICVNLGINMNIVPPYSGEAKPHVERLFGRLSTELFEQIPGYIGHNVAQREEIQARQSFESKIEAQRKWKEERKLRTKDEIEAWKDAWKIKKENLGLDLTVLLSADELQHWIDNWTNKMYEQEVHGGIQTSPLRKWQKDPTPVQGIPDIRMLDLLLGESLIRKVGKKGISFDGCNYAHVDLVEYTGKHVYCMAPQDMGQLLVYSEDMQFVCIAEDIEFMGQDRYKIRKARKRSQALMRQLDKIVKEAQAIHDTTIMDRIEAISIDETNQTIAVTKHTKAIDMLIETSPIIAAKDKVALEQSSKYDFKNKDENGKPIKVLPSGRPQFETVYDRFVWVLEHKDWNEKDEKLKEKNIEIYQMALEEANRRKIG